MLCFDKLTLFFILSFYWVTFIFFFPFFFLVVGYTSILLWIFILDGFRSIRCISVISFVGISSKKNAASQTHIYNLALRIIYCFFIIKIQPNESLELNEKSLANSILCILFLVRLYWYIFYVLFTYLLFSYKLFLSLTTLPTYKLGLVE